MKRLSFSTLFIILFSAFIVGLFFPRVVQAFWTTQTYVAETTGSVTKYNGQGYNGHDYYYFQNGGIYSPSNSSWAGYTTDQSTTFIWQAFIPSSNSGIGKADVKYIGWNNTNIVAQAMYSGWVIVLSDTNTLSSDLALYNSCVSGHNCSNLEIEWDDVNYSYWYKP